MGLKIRNCVFILDGLDECIRFNIMSKTHTLNDRTRFLQQLVNSAARTGSRILIVSRNDAEIRSHLRVESTESTPDLFYEYQITRQDTKDDISSFSNSVVDQKLPITPLALREEIAKEAAQKCDGMFLWIRLLNDRLFQGKNAKQLRKTISETPAGLEKAYDRDLKAISELEADDTYRAIAILRWTLFSVRSLTVRELTEALLISMDEEQTAFPSEDLPDIWDEY
jgi:hypothetical protein